MSRITTETPTAGTNLNITATAQEAIDFFKMIEQDANRLVGALRLLLLPLLTGSAEASCDMLYRFCCGGGKLGVNYWVGDRVIIVRGEVGTLRRWQIPCAVDKRRMPPLARYETHGLVQIKQGRIYVNTEILLRHPLIRAIRKVFEALAFCGVRRTTSLTLCAKLPEAEIVNALILSRLLYPNLLEVYNVISFDDFLARWGVGRVVPAKLLWEEARSFVRDSVVMPNAHLLPRVAKIVRSRAARYAIPPLLAHADFKDAVVADIGSGFGTKGAAAIRWGARYAILIDIDIDILKSRGNGILIDKLVADAHMLPLRAKSIDVAIFWNVYNFLPHPHQAVEEIKRATRREVVFSTYNASSGRYVTFEEFLTVAQRWGILKTVKRIGNSQFQAIVKI